MEFMVTVGCVSYKASVCPRVSDDGAVHVIVKTEVFEFVCPGRTNNGIVFCESQHNWFEVIVMCKDQILHVNVMKNFWSGGI